MYMYSRTKTVPLMTWDIWWWKKQCFFSGITIACMISWEFPDAALTTFCSIYWTLYRRSVSVSCTQCPERRIISKPDTPCLYSPTWLFYQYSYFISSSISTICSGFQTRSLVLLHTIKRHWRIVFFFQTISLYIGQTRKWQLTLIFFHDNRNQSFVKIHNFDCSSGRSSVPLNEL